MALLNNEPQVKISQREYQFIKTTYQTIVQKFYMINDERRNSPSVSFILRCLIELLYKDKYPSKFKELIKCLHC